MVNILLITLDGVGKKDVFNGPDKQILNKLNLNNEFNKKFNYKKVEDLLPFIHTELIPNSEVYTNMHVRNNVYLSYPGYNDILTGKTDSKIISNEYGTNLNKTFIEILNKKIKRHKILICTHWSTFIDIFGYKRSNIRPDNWSDEHDKPNFKPQFQHDMNVYSYFKHLLLKKKPNIMYLSLGLTDTFAHKKDYIKYWESLILADNIIKDLFKTINSIKKYKNDTVCIITTDHGRGLNYKNWSEHHNIKDSENVWAIINGKNIKKKKIKRKIFNTALFRKIMKFIN